MEPGARGYNCATLSLGDINTDIWFSRLWVRHKADDLALERRNYCSEIQRREDRMVYVIQDWNKSLAESSK
jgi:hypothetical protein